MRKVCRFALLMLFVAMAALSSGCSSLKYLASRYQKAHPPLQDQVAKPKDKNEDDSKDKLPTIYAE